MNTQNLLGIVLCMICTGMLPAASIDGILVRARIPNAELVSTSVALATPHPVLNENVSVKYVQYQLAIADAQVFIREGDVVMIDPDSLTTTVQKYFERTIGTRHVSAVLCQDVKQRIVGILIGQKANGNPDEPNSPQVYVSIRAESDTARHATLTIVLQALEIRPVNERSYSKLMKSELQGIFEDVLLATSCAGPN